MDKTLYFMWNDMNNAFVQVGKDVFDEMIEPDHFVNNKFSATADVGSDYTLWMFDVSFGNVWAAQVSMFANMAASITNINLHGDIPLNIPPFIATATGKLWLMPT